MIEGGEHRHLAHSLRLREGERVELLDGERIQLAEIVRVGKDHTDVRVLEIMPSREPAVRMALYIGALKGEKMDWVVQKTTELGVAAIVPVAMRRSVAQGIRADRLRRIAREAQKQCGRARTPWVEEIVPFAHALEIMRKHEVLLAAYEGGGSSFGEGNISVDLGIVIGPEGGIDGEEMDALLDIGARPVTLGPRILRAETAAVAALAGLMACAGEWT